MMKQKKLLLLGGSRYLMPVINKAHELGIYVITADYLPDNYAHKYADKYINVSIIDCDEVLRVAVDENIDGVMSFACDPGVVTAAYVAEKMHLPFQGSYESTKILQDKGLFRQFLADNGFNVPHAKSYETPYVPQKDIDWFSWPVIVKPVDSAGSKGVTKVNHKKDLNDAVTEALRYSSSGRYIIEDFITIKGFRSSADPFTIGGKLVYNFYSDQGFDKNAINPFIPDKIIYPSTMDVSDQKYLTKELERLFDLLKMDTGIYNIEACVGLDGRPYIMEVSPRGGGNKIAEEQHLAYGVDIIENEVRHAVGMPLIEYVENKCDGCWCNYSIHVQNDQSGVFNELYIDDDIKEKYVKVVDMTTKKGDVVRPFSGAGMSLGDMFLRFDSRQEMEEIMSRVNDWLKIILA